MRNIFLEKSYTKSGVETIPRPFYKKSKLSISLDQYFKIFIQFVYTLCQVVGYRNILEINLLLPHIKLFSKSKRGLELISLPQFLHDL